MLQKVFKRLEKTVNDDPDNKNVLLKSIFEARSVFLYLEHYGQLDEEQERLVLFCKAKLDEAREYFAMNDVNHALWIAVAAIKFFLERAGEQGSYTSNT